MIVRSHHGTYAIVTVGKINNTDEIVEQLFKSGHSHFLEMSGGDVNATELVASVINQKQNLIEGIQYAQEVIDGSMTMLDHDAQGHSGRPGQSWAAPRWPLAKRRDAYCVSFESFAYLNLGYTSRNGSWAPGRLPLSRPRGRARPWPSPART